MIWNYLENSHKSEKLFQTRILRHTLGLSSWESNWISADVEVRGNQEGKKRPWNRSFGQDKRKFSRDDASILKIKEWLERELVLLKISMAIYLCVPLKRMGEIIIEYFSPVFIVDKIIKAKALRQINCHFLD